MNQLDQWRHDPPPKPSLARFAERFGWPAWALFCIVAAAVAFYGPALQVSHGEWPAPLDDSYIYYGFARSAAAGEPFVWAPGNGYSSGATSMLYPLLLAPFWAIGLRGSWLGLGAAIIALAALFDLSRSLRATLKHRLAQWAAPLLVVCVPLLDWSWFSGMELAVFGAVLGRALKATQQCLRAAVTQRRRFQRRSGRWLALLVLARPEATALVAVLALAMAYRGRSLSARSSLWRCAGPSALTLLLLAGLNLHFTGELQPAGAIRKLYAHAPFESVQSDVIEVTKNLLVVAYQAGVRAWGGFPWGLACVAVAGVAMTKGRNQLLAKACVLGTLCMVFLTCLNNTARFQNYRYAAPALALGCCVLAWGLDALARRPWLAGAAAVAVVLAPAGQFARQTQHFALASRNIIEQHGEAARQLRQWSPPPRRVLVGDAGAIVYLSELRGLDGLGLGGYHRYPFARASRHGVANVVELIEAMPTAERPDAMALYPGWWTGLADVFGKPVSRIRIQHNVICAADTKVLYRADWRRLDTRADWPAGAWLSLDVGNLLDEKKAHYEMAAPQGGRPRAVMLRAADARPLWDSGRRYPVGIGERFTVPHNAAGPERAADFTAAAQRNGALGPTRLVVRSDADGGASHIEVSVWRDGQPRRQAAAALPRHPGHWSQVQVFVGELRRGDVLELRGRGGEWRSYHLWLVPAAEDEGGASP